jgi:hypothetical protein
LKRKVYFNLKQGDLNGPRNFTLDAGCASSDHPPARDVFASLIRRIKVETIINPRVADGSVAITSAPSKSTASWPAIFAGAFVAAGATLILIALGSGIGFASISPWQNRGVSVTTFAMTTAIWLVVTQWISAGLGGYIAGRLRTRWIGTHVHEVFFRDTAHGLVTWAVATVLVAAVATGTLMSGVGAGTRAVGEVASAGVQGAAGAAASPNSSFSANSAYGIDKLFRPVAGSNGASGGTGATSIADARAETGHILANAVATGSMPDADRSYLVDQVVDRTGISRADAQSRVDSFVAAMADAQTQLKAEADAARKAASQASIYLALSLLVGAFIASVSAAVGGRLRDEHI